MIIIVHPSVPSFRASVSISGSSDHGKLQIRLPLQQSPAARMDTQVCSFTAAIFDGNHLAGRNHTHPLRFSGQNCVDSITGQNCSVIVGVDLQALDEADQNDFKYNGWKCNVMRGTLTRMVMVAVDESIWQVEQVARCRLHETQNRYGLKVTLRRAHRINTDDAHLGVRPSPERVQILALQNYPGNKSDNNEFTWKIQQIVFESLFQQVAALPSGQPAGSNLYHRYIESLWKHV